MPHPYFQHDCSCCHFLGSAEHDGSPMDLYVHRTGIPTVIARFGSAGANYTSGLMASYGHSKPLTDARRLAQEKGLLTYDALQALAYTNMDCEQSVAELRAALPFTLEYQAVLAYEKGDLDRSEGLAEHLVHMELAPLRKRGQNANRLSSAVIVANRMSRALSARRKMAHNDAVELSHRVCRFIFSVPLTKDAYQV